MAESEWDAHYADGNGYRLWPCEELVRFMATQKPGTSWLEAGCGGGGNLACMRMRGRQVVGVDIHMGALQRARLGHALVSQADVFALPFADESFDGVVDSMVSQHLSEADHARVYAEYVRVLKPGGILWVYHLDAGTTGKSRQVGKYDWARVDLFPDVGHFFLPPQEKLMQVLRDAGTSVVESRGMSRRYPDGQVASYSIVTARKEHACGA